MKSHGNSAPLCGMLLKLPATFPMIYYISFYKLGNKTSASNLNSSIRRSTFILRHLSKPFRIISSTAICPNLINTTTLTSTVRDIPPNRTKNRTTQVNATISTSTKTIASETQLKATTATTKINAQEAHPTTSTSTTKVRPDSEAEPTTATISTALLAPAVHPTTTWTSTAWPSTLTTTKYRPIRLIWHPSRLSTKPSSAIFPVNRRRSALHHSHSSLSALSRKARRNRLALKNCSRIRTTQLAVSLKTTSYSLTNMKTSGYHESAGTTERLRCEVPVYIPNNAKVPCMIGDVVNAVMYELVHGTAAP